MARSPILSTGACAPAELESRPQHQFQTLPGVMTIYPIRLIADDPDQVGDSLVMFPEPPFAESIEASRNGPKMTSATCRFLPKRPQMPRDCRESKINGCLTGRHIDAYAFYNKTTDSLLHHCLRPSRRMSRRAICDKLLFPLLRMKNAKSYEKSDA